MSEAPSPFIEGTHLQFAIDATSLGYAKECLQKYKYTIIDGWRQKDESVHLRFGSEFARWLEFYHKHLARSADHEAALDETVAWMLASTYDWRTTHPKKNRETLVRSVIWYLENYKNDPAKTLILSNGAPAVELSFKIELPWEAVPSQNYIYCGHMDKIVDYDGSPFVMDQKSTSSNIGPYFFKDFNPHTQMSGYSFAGRTIFNIPVVGVIIDAVKVVGGFTEFGRGFTMRTEAQLDEWLEDTKHWTEIIRFAAERNYWPKNEASCLSGDSEVLITRGSRASWRVSISYLYELFHGVGERGPQYNKNLVTYIRTADENHAALTKVINVFKNGTKPTLILTTELNELRLTEDHKVRTESGWKLVTDLTIKDKIIVWDSHAGGCRKVGRSWNRITGIINHPYGQKHFVYDKDYKILPKYRLAVEAEMNNLSLEEFIHILKKEPEIAASLNYISPEMDVHHHKDHNETNDDLSNLEVLHWRKHNHNHIDDRVSASLRLKSSRVVEIKLSGLIEEVYDVEVAHKDHSYIANGLVVHNCHKYGGCIFREICSQDPSVRQNYLETNFEKNFWNPLQSR